MMEEEKVDKWHEAEQHLFPASECHPRNSIQEKSSPSQEQDGVHAMFVGSVANFGVAYNLTNITIALLFLSKGDEWYDDDRWGGNVSSILKSIIFFGAIMGMCVMGFVGDVLGRNAAFAVTSMFMIVFSLLSAFAPAGKDEVALILLAGFRFGTGFGIGGCYPLSAAKSSEESADRSVTGRNQAVGIVFFWQSFGAILPYLLGMALTVIKSAIWQFRIILAIGAIPPAIVLYYTYGEDENEEFKESRRKRTESDARLSEHQEGYVSLRDSTRGQTSKTFLHQLQIGFQDPKVYNHLASTALCWGLYDIAYFGANQFTPEITEMVFKGQGIFALAWQDSVTMCLGVPSMLHTIRLLRTMGTKKLQVYGFALISLSCIILAVAWTPLRAVGTPLAEGTLFGLYCVFFFFVNWGPNITTFVLPQEVYATEVRGTFNGIAAACGKTGALLGIWIFEKVNQAMGVVPLMVIVAILNAIGAVVSHYCISDDLWKAQNAPNHHPRKLSTDKFV